jgi:hypothetical protein
MRARRPRIQGDAYSHAGGTRAHPGRAPDTVMRAGRARTQDAHLTR